MDLRLPSTVRPLIKKIPGLAWMRKFHVVYIYSFIAIIENYGMQQHRWTAAVFFLD